MYWGNWFLLAVLSEPRLRGGRRGQNSQKKSIFPNKLLAKLLKSHSKMHIDGFNMSLRMLVIMSREKDARDKRERRRQRERERERERE